MSGAGEGRFIGLVLAVACVACSADDAARAGKGGAPDGAAPMGGSSGSGGSGPTGGAGQGGSGAAGAAGSGGQGGAAPSASQFWSDFSTALCHHYLHCYGENYGGQELRALGGEAECSAALVKWIAKSHPHVGALSSAVTAGTMSIQSGAAERCLAATASCNYPIMTAPEFEIQFSDITPCREVFEGTVAAGGDCDMSEECSGDSMCLSDATATTPCSGKCRPRKVAGDACTVDRECGAPSPAAWPICEDHKCVVVNVHPPGADGADCGRAPASDESPCGGDLWCPSGAFGVQSLDHCRTPLALGDDCFVGTGYFDLECMHGFFNETCTPFVVQASVGDSCTVAGELCDSFSSLYCDSTCKRSEGTTPGGCNARYWFQQALCPPLIFSSDGSSCTSHDSCASGICRIGHSCTSTLCSAE
jgi:hypothetical protein